MIKEYINNNKERFLDELFELLKIESVSADSKFKEEVDKAANWLVEEFKKLKLDNKNILKTNYFVNFFHLFRCYFICFFGTI